MESDDLSYYLYRLAGALVPHIPVQVGYALAAGVGSLICRASHARRIVEDNVSHVLALPADSPRVRRLACSIFRNQAKNYFDLLRLSALSTEDIRRLARSVQGREHIEKALARGHGAVLISAHFGNFDLAAQVVALYGYRVTTAAERLRPERLFEYVRSLRESHGLRFIPIDASLRPMFRALHNNEIVGLVLDRNVTDAGRPVEFFGQPARMPDGYLRLALRTGAPLLVAFCHRLPDGAFEVNIEPEVQLERTGDMEHDLSVSQRRVIAIFERYLRRYPDQWVYFQPVWPQPVSGERRRVKDATAIEEMAR